MKTYYYIHVWGIEGFDSLTELTANSEVENPGIEVDFWPKGDLFSIVPMYFATEQSRLALLNNNLTGIDFRCIDRVSAGPNLISNFPDMSLPPHFWTLTISGEIGRDDFVTWGNKYLAVSNEAMACLRSNNVTHAEFDEINMPFDMYFSSERVLFWMPEGKIKQYLLSKIVN